MESVYGKKGIIETLSDHKVIMKDSTKDYVLFEYVNYLMARDTHSSKQLNILNRQVDELILRIAELEDIIYCEEVREEDIYL